VPLAAAGVITVLAWLPRDDQPFHPARVWHQVDPAGLALFSCALTVLLVFLMDLTAPRWWLLAVAAVLLLGLTAREVRAREPFIDVRMLARNRALTTTYLRFGVSMAVTYGFIYGWTPWLEQSGGLSATAAGLLMMPAFAVAAVVSGVASRGCRIRPPLIAGAVALTAVSVSLTMLRASAPLWLLLAVSIVFGAQNGLNVVTNQAAMYAQAPADAVGAAAGMLRTSMYLGAIASASLISLSYGRAATDPGLHRLGLMLTIAAIALVVLTVSDRSRVGTGEAGLSVRDKDF
jgi:hypothetical protein